MWCKITCTTLTRCRLTGSMPGVPATSLVGHPEVIEEDLGSRPAGAALGGLRDDLGDLLQHCVLLS